MPGRGVLTRLRISDFCLVSTSINGHRKIIFAEVACVFLSSDFVFRMGGFCGFIGYVIAINWFLWWKEGGMFIIFKVSCVISFLEMALFLLDFNEILSDVICHY